MKSANQISSPILLLVEGHDEKFLLDAMLLRWFPEQAKSFDVENAQGGAALKNRFKAVVNRPRAAGVTLKAVGVIADAEESREATEQAWLTLITQEKNRIAAHCQNLILPINANMGSIETVLLQAFAEDPLIECATSFRDCVKSIASNNWTSAQYEKLALQSWLNAKLGNVYRNIHKAMADDQAAHKIDINFDHSSFEPIKNFLSELLAHV